MKEHLPPSPVSAAKDATSSPLMVNQQEQERLVESLPLGWTRVQRRSVSATGTGNTSGKKQNRNDTTNKRRSRSTTSDKPTNATDEVCTDFNCRRCQDDILFDGSDNDVVLTSAISDNTRRYSGKVFFCLPDADCDWFQGYYFPFTDEFDNDDSHDGITVGEFSAARLIHQFSTNYSHPYHSFYYGLLCHVKQDIDECLQCAVGGYREISIMDMTLMEYKNQSKTDQRPTPMPHNINNVTNEDNIDDPADTTVQPPPKRMKVSNVIWLGGSMMNLYKTKLKVASKQSVVNNNVSLVKNDNITYNDNDETNVTVSVLRMQSTTLHTGSDRTTPYVQKYFTSLLHNMSRYQPQQQQQQLMSSSKDSCQQMIEQLMPDVAIVVGTMDLWIST